MVLLKVDLTRRRDLEKLHTGTHILNYSLRKVLGNHVWQNGSNLKREFGTLDITHYKNLSYDEIVRVENLANEIICSKKRVIVEELPRDEAEKRYGFILYQGGAIPMVKLRIVKIEDSDVEACGGLHVSNSSDVNLLKIIETQKIQDGVVRVKFVVGEYALRYFQEIESIIMNIKSKYNIEKGAILKTIDKFFENWKSESKLNSKLKELLIEGYVNLFNGKEVDEINLKSVSDMGLLIDLYNRLSPLKKDLVIKSEKFVISAKSNLGVSAKKVIDKKDYKIYVL